MSGIFSLILPYKVRCNLPECNKQINLVFKRQMENGEMATFCSPDHANIGLERWEEKVKMNLKPGQIPPIETEEMVSDNLQELDEKL